MLATLCALSVARTAWAEATPIRFGILPIGGALESRTDWEPLLRDMARFIDRPVGLFSATSYEGLNQAIRRGSIDMAFLSGKLALDAVVQHGMRVVAQVYRHDGLTGYRSMIVTRKGAAPASIREVLAHPERWRLARAEKSSLSGYIVPQLQLFLPHQIVMETRFQSETVGTHQSVALAVANGEADIGINNTADLERFAVQFPREAARLQVIWESELIPHAQIVMRASYAQELVARVQDFLSGYGRGDGPEKDSERAVLKALSNLAGFRVADNTSLLPAARLDYDLARENALNAQFVSEEARRLRLARIERTYAAQQNTLRGAATPGR